MTLVESHLQSLNAEQLKARLVEAQERLLRDQRQYGQMVLIEAHEVIQSDRERIESLRRAIAIQEEAEGGS